MRNYMPQKKSLMSSGYTNDTHKKKSLASVGAGNTGSVTSLGKRSSSGGRFFGSQERRATDRTKKPRKKLR